MTSRRMLSALVLWSTGAIGATSGCATARVNFDLERERMVSRQITAADRGITNAQVIAALRAVPRHELVPENLRSAAYTDRPLSIGYGQTISQPYIVAFMTEQLDPKPSDKILEIGTGSGYQAAVLSRLVAEVYTIEIVEPLAKKAARDLERLGCKNVKVKAGDGYEGWPEAAPFDAIIVTCAPDHVPPALVEQLKEGGRIIIPVGDVWNQELYLLEKKDGEVRKRAVLPVRFVPLTRDGSRENEE